MELLFFALSVALYLLATANFVTHLMTVHRTAWRLSLIVLTAAFTSHTLAILVRGLSTGQVPVFSFYDQLSLLAWLTVGVYLLLELRYSLAVLGGLVSPLAFLFTLSAYLVYSGVESVSRSSVPFWLPAHVAPAFLGYAVFAVAFCISVIYLVQENQLKAKRRGRILQRLPSLETLDDLNYRFVAWGFALFTIGIVTGALLAKATRGEFWTWSDPIQTLSMMAWMLYAGLLHARSVGWRGRRAATLTIAGFALLVVSLVGVNLLFPGRHGGTMG